MMPKKEPTFLSASRIKTLDTCSWLYWGKYHLKMPDKTNSGALRGTLCHNIFEYLLKPRHKRHYKDMLTKGSIKGSKAVNRYVKSYLHRCDIESFGKETYEENYDLCDKMILVGLRSEFFGGEGAKIEKPEQEFKIKSKKPKYNIYGFMDKPVLYGDTLYIVDYKSSKQKFRGEELNSNVQAMMYTLAAKKLWPKVKKIIVQFLFLRFPRSPSQELEFSGDQIKGFEHYLEHLNKMINDFDEPTAKSNYGFDNGHKWLCGPAKSGWICPLKEPYNYYILKNKKGQTVKSAFKEEDLSPVKGEKIEVVNYEGCPRFYSAAAKEMQQKEEDMFDF